MRKQLLASASAAALVFGLATGAMAQQASSDVNGQTRGNTIQATGSTFGNTIQQSGQGSTGVTHMQSNNGSANVLNLGSSVVTSTNIGVGSTFTAEALVGQGSTGLVSKNNAIGSASGSRTSTVSDSFNSSASGVVGVQQNDGHANAIGQSNAIAGLTTPSSGNPLPTIDQDAKSSGETIRNHGTDGGGFGDEDTKLSIDAGQDRDNIVDDNSLDGFDGVATVQQNTGDANVIGASSSVVGFTGSGDRDFGELDQDVTAEGIVQNTPGEGIIDEGSDRRNEVTNSAQNLTGITTVQQNNGTHNAIMAATGVTGENPTIVDSTEQGDDSVKPGNIDQDVLAIGSFGADNENANEDTGVQATDKGGFRRNTIQSGSFNSASGIFTVQENNGDTNTINAATGVAVVQNDVNAGNNQNDDTPSDGGIDQVARASGNDVRPNSGSDLDLVSKNRQGTTYERANTVRNSFKTNEGLGTVQQNNGNANALNAATAVTAASEGSGDADDLIAGGVTQTADAGSNDLVGESAGNRAISLDADDLGQGRLNRIDEKAFDNLSGDVNVQQNNGDGNTLNQATAIVATTSETNGGVTQNTRASQNTVNTQLDDENNEVISVVSTKNYERNNEIGKTFRDADGTVNVQQNNGDVNTVNAATTVFGSIFGNGNDPGTTPQQAGTINGGLTQKFTLVRNNDVDNINGNAAGDPNGAADLGGTRDNLIESGAFRDVAGTSTVQQNNGSANSMNVATAVAGTQNTSGSNGNLNGGITQSTVGGFDNGDGIDNDIGAKDRSVQVTATGTDIDGENLRENEITGSFGDANGVHSVQQNNGDANSVNAASAVASVSGNASGGVTQDVDMTGSTIRNVATYDGQRPGGDKSGSTTRDNTLSDAFTGSVGGIVTVQQNNGSANSINSATAVVDASDVSGDVTQPVTGDGTISNVATTTADDADRDNTIDSGSFETVSGVVTTQQNNGDANVMTAGQAVTNTADPNSPGVVDQDVTLTGSEISATFGDVSLTDNGSERTNEITGALEIDGIGTVQQNNGDGNVMNVATSATLSNGTVAEVDQDVNINNNTVSGAGGSVDVTDTGSDRGNTLSDAAANSSGVLSLQQNNGNANQMQAGTAVVFATDVTSNTVNQTVNATGNTVTGVTTSVTGGERTNTVTNGSFNGVSGVTTAQQNNGDANTMAAGTAVTAALGQPVSQVTLNGSTTDNTVEVTGSSAPNPSTNTVTGSFNNVSGVTTLQQNNGNNNVIQSGITVSANF